jgi:hypothetical protein
VSDVAVVKHHACRLTHAGLYMLAVAALTVSLASGLLRTYWH